MEKESSSLQVLNIKSLLTAYVRHTLINKPSKGRFINPSSRRQSEQIQENVTKYKQIQAKKAHESKCKQMQANASECKQFKQIQATTNKCNQIQANASKCTHLMNVTI